MTSPPPTPERRALAGEMLAARFNRTMNACTSPRGFLCDLSMAALFSALPLVLIVRQTAGDDLLSATTLLLFLMALLPVLVSLGVGLSLRNARERVIDWMAVHPFPLENMNSLLAGISDEFEILFLPGAPLLPREEMQKLVDRISDDVIATGVDEEIRSATVKIGVIDSKRTPLHSNHLRYARFQRLVDEVLLPLHERHPIAAVRVI